MSAAEQFALRREEELVNAVANPMPWVMRAESRDPMLRPTGPPPPPPGPASHLRSSSPSQPYSAASTEMSPQRSSPTVMGQHDRVRYLKGPHTSETSRDFLRGNWNDRMMQLHDEHRVNDLFTSFNDPDEPASKQPVDVSLPRLFDGQPAPRTDYESLNRNAEQAMFAGWMREIATDRQLYDHDVLALGADVHREGIVEATAHPNVKIGVRVVENAALFATESEKKAAEQLAGQHREVAIDMSWTKKLMQPLKGSLADTSYTQGTNQGGGDSTAASPNSGAGKDTPASESSDKPGKGGGKKRRQPQLSSEAGRRQLEILGPQQYGLAVSQLQIHDRRPRVKPPKVDFGLESAFSHAQVQENRGMTGVETSVFSTFPGMPNYHSRYDDRTLPDNATVSKSQMTGWVKQMSVGPTGDHTVNGNSVAEVAGAMPREFGNIGEITKEGQNPGELRWINWNEQTSS